MAGSEAIKSFSTLAMAASPTEEEVASMHRFIENALDLLVKVPHLVIYPLLHTIAN